MNSTRTGGTQRALAAALILIIGLGTMLFGFAGGATAADSNRVPEAICHPVAGANGGNTGAGYNLESPDASGIHLENGVPKHSFGGRVDTLLGGDLLCPGEADTETETRSVVGAPDCEAGTVTTSHQERSRTEIAYDVWGEWSAWTETSTSSRPATEQECPPYVLKTETETRSVDGAPNCATDTVPISNQERTRTETAEGVWGAWSEWTETSTSSRPATDVECPPYVLKTETGEQTIDGTPDCENDTVPVYDQERTRTETAEGVWGDWSAWETVSTSSRDATDTECPPYVLKTETGEQTIDGTPDCENDTVPVYDQERTRTETAEGVWGDWSAWETVSTSSRDATDTECPPYVLKSETGEQTIDGTPDCENDTVPVYDQERTRTETAEGIWGDWSAWETVSTSSRDATDTECPPEVLNDEVEYQDAEGDPDCDTDTVPVWDEKRSPARGRHRVGRLDEGRGQ